MDGLLCHCRVNPDGHEPGTVLDCEAVPVKRGRITPFTLLGRELRDHKPSEVAAGVYRELAYHASEPGVGLEWMERAGRASHPRIDSPWFGL